jgi:formate dehydrogenase major subunit
VTAKPSDQAPDATSLAAARLFPSRREKRAPCGGDCVGGGDARAWIGIVAQRRKLGLSVPEALENAWYMLTAVNPFPATLGRVCPHPCQDHCTRAQKDGAVAVNALERFLGDWALARGLSLPRLAAAGSQPESVGVIGAGPAGFSFAYQMARRGYAVSIYERESVPGGMLQFGIPQYRLPEEVLAAEVHRILDLGVTLHLGTAVGRDVSLDLLRDRHRTLFLGIGANRGLTLGIPGEEGSGTWTGTGYLSQVNRGIAVALGRRVAVVGGGNTAIDAARCARRTGADVTLLYRRTRHEMPAIDAEVDDALAEGVRIEFLTAPVEIVRENSRICSLVVQRMALGEPDRSGRRSPIAIPGSEQVIAVDSVIAAVSQQPDWDGLGALAPTTPWLESNADHPLTDHVWAGGDSRGLGLAGGAIRQGRQAAELAHARLRGLPLPPTDARPPLAERAVRTDFYAGRAPVSLSRRGPDAWRAEPDLELAQTITEAEFLAEAERCLSCGLCFGCEQCFMYCNNAGLQRLDHPARGQYFELSAERCVACGKCIDLCPCGFLEPE